MGREKSGDVPNPMNVMVELRDRNHPDMRHDPLHVDVGFTTGNIGDYLNSVLQQSRSYRFYMDGLLFDGSLASAMTRRGMGPETGLTIEYETDGNTTPDVRVELEDVVSFMRVSVDGGPCDIWCSTYGGELRTYKYEDGCVVRVECQEHHGVQDVCVGEQTYLYDRLGRVVCVETGRVLFEVAPNQITCMGSSGDMVSVGTRDGRCLVFGDRLECVCEFGMEMSSTDVRDGTVTFTSLDGQVGIFCVRDGTMQHRRGGYNITSMDCRDGVRIFGTPCSRLVVSTGDKEDVVETNIRFCCRISMHSKDVAAQVSQYTVSVLNVRDSTEIRRVTVDKPISGAGWIGDMLFVSTGSDICGYSMSKFLNKAT